MFLRRFVVAAVASGILVGGALLSGQEPAGTPQQSQWLIVTIVKVHQGAAAKYTELQTKEVMPAQRKGGSLGRQAWSSGVSGPPREIVYLSPIQSFAQFDKPSPLITALGQDGAAALNARTAELAEPLQTMLVRTRPDLSYVPNPGQTSPLAIVSIVEVVPGRRTEFEAFLKKDVLPAMQKAKAKAYSVMEVVYGDATNTYVTAVGYDTYEAIGKGHPFQVALGEEGARKLDSRAAGIVSRVERFISRHRPDLSWSPKPGTN